MAEQTSIDNDKRNIFNKLNIGISVYNYNDKIIIYLTNLKVNIIDTTKKNYVIHDNNVNPDNITFTFEALGIKFSVHVKVNILGANYDDEDYITNLKFIETITVNGSRDDKKIVDHNDIIVVFGNDMKFCINYENDRKFDVKPYFCTIINFSCAIVDPTKNAQMHMLIEHVNARAKGATEIEEDDALKEMLNDFTKLDVTFNSYSDQKNGKISTIKGEA